MPADKAADSHRSERLSQAETRHALLTAAIAWGIFGSAWASMVTGAPFVTFARTRLEVSTFVFGLLSAVPFLGVLAQLPGSYWVERWRQRKRLFMTTNAGNRLVWLLVAALPWAIPGQHGDLRVAALVVLMLVGSSLGHMGTPAWFSWFADMVPERIRGRYLGNRAALATVTAIAVSATVTWVLDRDSSFRTFTILFSLAALLGLTDILLFWTVREPPMPPRRGEPWRLRDVVLEPLRDRPFRGYLLYAWSEAFMFGISGPFFWLIGLEFLGIGNFWSNLYIMLVPMVFTAMALPVWGGLCDRFGSRPLVALGTLVSIIFPVFWVLARPAHYHGLLGTAAVVGGLFAAAIQVGDMNMLFSLTPRENRSSYLAVLALASSSAWAVAPTLGGAVAQALKPIQLHVLGLTLNNLHLLMLVSTLARLSHLLFIIPRLPERKSRSLSELARHLVGAPLRYGSRLFTSPRGNRG